MKKSAAKTDSPKVTRRPAEREAFVPYEKNDEQLVELLTTITEKGKEVDLLEKAIAKLKESKKAPEEAYNAAIASLRKGKPVKVMCWEIYMWDERKIFVRRQDNDELLSEEVIDSEAVPLDIGDEVVVQ